MKNWHIFTRLARGILRRRKRLALFTFVAALFLLGPVAYYLATETPRFSSSATIFLESRPSRVPIFQELSPFRPLPVQLAILQSRSLAEGVLDRLPKPAVDELIENTYALDYLADLKDVYRRIAGAPREAFDRRQRALDELRNGRVSFEPWGEGGDGLVGISAVASQGQVAVDIVNTYIDVLLARTRSFNMDDARVSREFLERQLADVKRKLRASEEAVRTFTITHGGIAIPDQSQTSVARLSEAVTALAEVETRRKMTETRLQGLRDKLQQQQRTSPPAPIAAVAPPPPGIDRLREQLTQLESTLLELRDKYTERHPSVIRVKDRIAEVQGELGDLVKVTTLVVPAPGAVPPAEQRDFAQQVIVLETAGHTLAAQEAALRSQVTSLRRSLSGLSRDEMEYVGLVREADSTKALHALLSESLTAARIQEQGDMKVVKVIDPPSPPASSDNRKLLKFLGLAVLGAVVLGGGVPAVVEWTLKRVETVEDVEAATGLPVLAVVPRVRSRRPLFVSVGQSPSGGHLTDEFILVETFRSLRIAVQLAARAEGLRTLLITSAAPGEGKSTVIVNLGLAFREAGVRVGLVDTDFLRPTLHKKLTVPSNGQLVEALESNQALERSLTSVGEGMWLVPHGGAMEADTRGMLATNRLKELLASLARQADIVLCDSPPILLAPDDVFLATAVDGVILVAKVGGTGCRDLARAKSLLEGAGAKIVGVVVNEMPVSALRPYYRRYYRAYYTHSRA